jgi:hypothetical protein
MSTQKVVSIKPPKDAEPQAVGASAKDKRSLAKIIATEIASEVVEAALSDNEYGPDLRNIFAGRPHLRTWIERFAGYVSSVYPASEPNAALLNVTLREANTLIADALHQHEWSDRRIEACFAEGLARSCVAMSQVGVFGSTENDGRYHWEPFSMPLKDWIRHYKIDRVKFDVDPKPNMHLASGLRVKILASCMDTAQVATWAWNAPGAMLIR